MKTKSLRCLAVAAGLCWTAISARSDILLQEQFSGGVLPSGWTTVNSAVVVDAGANGFVLQLDGGNVGQSAVTTVSIPVISGATYTLTFDAATATFGPSFSGDISGPHGFMALQNGVAITSPFWTTPATSVFPPPAFPPSPSAQTRSNSRRVPASST